MSYIVSNFYQNPPPPYGALYGRTTESLNTVPGWGVQAYAAGPEFVGIGALQVPPKLTAAPIPQGEGFPWWGWIVGAGLIGTAFGVAVKRGWV